MFRTQQLQVIHHQYRVVIPHTSFARLMEEIARAENMAMRDQPYDPGPAFAEHHFGDVTWEARKV